MDKHCISLWLLFGLAFVADGLMDKYGSIWFLLIATAVLVGAALIEWRCKGAEGETNR